MFADRVLADLSPVSDQMYGVGGRPWIPPERQLKASLLISLYARPFGLSRRQSESVNYGLV